MTERSPVDELFSSLKKEDEDGRPADEDEFAKNIDALKQEYPNIDEGTLRDELFRLKEAGMSFTDAATDIRSRFAQQNTLPEGEPVPESASEVESPAPSPVEEKGTEEVPVAGVSEATPVAEESVGSVETPVVTDVSALFGGGTSAPSEVETAEGAPVGQVESVQQVPSESIFPGMSQEKQEMAPDVPALPGEFDVSPEKPKKSLVIMVYSEKGDGKTTLALSLPGKIAALSFDHMTRDVHETMYNKDPRIEVWDALRYLDMSSEEAWVKSSAISLRYVDKLLDEAKEFGADWILIDGEDKYVKMSEMAMRYYNNFSIIDGVPWQYWKYRRLYINQLHMKALRIAKAGLVYTAYVNTKVKKKGDQITDTEDHPKWVDVVEEESKVVIRVRSKQFEEGRRYYAEVDSSKWGRVSSGIRVDITVPEGETPDCFQKLLDYSEEFKRRRTA